LIALYGLAAALSAALLFAVQPLFARLVLPMLGGAPAVWSTTQVFFQVALLAGYAYAHLGARLAPRRQICAHFAVLLLPLLASPIGAGRAPLPPAASPVPWLLLTLLTTVGLPFFVLAATGPLLQRWLASTAHPRAADPYPLYAASNLGSAVALVAYPILIEPSVRLSAQGSLWSWGYGVLALLVAACAVLALKAPPSPPRDPLPPPARLRVARWTALALVPAALTLGTTAQLSANLAAVPLFWIVPLGIYLLTFVLAFLDRPLVPHHRVVAAVPLAIVIGLVAGVGPAQPAWLFLGLALLALFVIALACHGELARDRPAPAQLTGFYFWLALGGALGSAAAGLLAPLVLRTVEEVPAALVAAAFVVPPADGEARSKRVQVFRAALTAAAVGVALLAKQRGLFADGTLALLGLAVLTHLVVVIAPQPARFGLAVAAVLVGVRLVGSRTDGIILRDRSFFGALTVAEQPGDERVPLPRRTLFHGTTIHGVQAIAPEAQAEPRAYYGREGPLGQLFAAGLVRDEARVGVVGLGVGAAMAYARPGQRWTFFEIDPAVAKIAEDSRYFTHLSAASAPHEVVIGDARRSLAATTERFSLLVLDAYSGDALPVHLLTREAFARYLDRLAEGGLLAAHISHRSLDLLPVMAGVADALGLAWIHQNASASPAAAARAEMSSRWVIFARRAEDFGPLGADPRWRPPTGRGLLWTDDRASVLQIWSGR
jgi:hypothetical protein